MDIYLGGAEVPTWRNHLDSAGADFIAVNFTHLRDRLPKTKSFGWAKAFGGLQVALYCTFPDDWGAGAQRELEDDYSAFLEDWGDSAALVVEPGTVHSARARPGRLAASWSDHYAPLWDGEEPLDDILARTELVAVTEEVMAANQMVGPRLQRAMASGGVQLVTLGVSKPDELAKLRPAAAITSSWISASRYGETQLWDGGKLRRFHADNAKEAANKAKVMARQAGLDPEKLAAGDDDERVALAIWSWRRLGDSMAGRRAGPPSGGGLAANQPDHPGTQEVEVDPPEADNGAPGGGTLEVVRDTVPLPVMGLTQVPPPEDPPEDYRPEYVLSVSPRSLRKCDMCVLQANCPGFKAHNTCAYDIPLEIRTKDQLTALMRGMIEMQGGRVLFAKMGEDLAGGHPTEAVSLEMERLMRIIEKMKNITDTRDFVSVKIEGRGSGALSSIFGAQVGEQARALPSGGLDEMETGQVMAEILDAEVLEDV